MCYRPRIAPIASLYCVHLFFFLFVRLFRYLLFMSVPFFRLSPPPVYFQMGIAVRHMWVISNIQFLERQDAKKSSNPPLHIHRHMYIREHGTPIDIICLNNLHTRTHLHMHGFILLENVSIWMVLVVRCCYKYSILLDSNFPFASKCEAIC